MIDQPQDYSSTFPYQCRGCGTAMRTRGADGYCLWCIEATPLRCERCHRLRFDPAEEWQDHPGQVPGEVVGVCHDCGQARHRAAKAQYEADCRRTVHRMATGALTAVLPENPFEGFEDREGE